MKHLPSVDRPPRASRLEKNVRVNQTLTLEATPRLLPHAAGEASGKENAIATRVTRGITHDIAPRTLRAKIWLYTLAALQRFRVVRAIDIAIAYAAERSFRAALTSAQETMRKLSKEGMVLRYRTDRQQHVYGLTEKGARWLRQEGLSATASVRRVAGMSNPEHQLWINFFTLAAEARGLRAMSESELLREIQQLNRHGVANGSNSSVHYLLKINEPVETGLRPDAVCFETDGVTWFEIDRSMRGSLREKSMRGLVRSVGKWLPGLERSRNLALKNATLRRVVFLCRTEQIYKRLRSIVTHEASERAKENLTPGGVGSRHFREISDGIYEVWAAVYPDEKSPAEDECVGHVIIQMLPVWMPKARLDKNFRAPTKWGWFDENYLPYQRPNNMHQWIMPSSPLLDGDQ